MLWTGRGMCAFFAEGRPVSTNLEYEAYADASWTALPKL